MAKILTDEEMGEIIFRAITDSGILDDAQQYSRFLEDLSGLICAHFGGDTGAVSMPDFGPRGIEELRCLICGELVPGNKMQEHLKQHNSSAGKLSDADARRVFAEDPDVCELGWACGFHINECVPDDGGIFKDYDKGVTWKNGVEVQS